MAVLTGPSFLDVWERLLNGMHVELLPADAQELVRTAPTPRADLFLGYWADLLADQDEDRVARASAHLAELRESNVSYDFVTGAEPPAPYRRWLEAALPEVRTTVLPGSGHFPHLAHPAEVARILHATEGVA